MLVVVVLVVFVAMAMSFANNLIKANGIIGEHLACTIHYFDFDKEEEQCGIARRTSTIAL
eukprot:11991640-Ditylum_brightwellii.AAC.1